MLYDQFGRKIEDNTEQPNNGIMIIGTPEDRNERDVSRGLTPLDVDRIMTAANSGETADQSRLAMELIEKDWDIKHAIETRINAVLGVERTIEPGDDSPQAKSIAEEFEAMLDKTGRGKLDTFNEMLEDMMTALLPGFAISEIIWNSEGNIDGFSFVPQHHFTFRNSYTPLLMTTDSHEGIELPDTKLVVHKYRAHGGDPARGGLIRPLAWLHCFSSVNMKDLLRFIERYGMPFTVARVDENSWKNERRAIMSLIRNFGPNGGGVFSKSTELQLLQAANNGGDVYFKLLEYTGMAKTKIILGQTATAGDGGGWSNDGAQSQVRQDILEADCERLDNTVHKDIARPWTLFNYGPDAIAPKLVSHSEPPEDSEKYYNALKARCDSMGVAIRAGLLTPTPEDEDMIREIFELPKLPQSAKAEWNRAKNIRLPITLQKASDMEPAVKTPQTADTAVLSDDPVNDTQDREERYRKAANALVNAFHTSLALSAVGVNPGDSVGKLAANAVDQSIQSGAIEKWLGKFQRKLDEIANIADPVQMQEAALALSEESPDFLKLFDSEDFTKILEQTVYAAAVQGKADKAGALNLKGGLK